MRARSESKKIEKWDMDGRGLEEKGIRIVNGFAERCYSCKSYKRLWRTMK